jgi:hypothetical protein
MTHFLTAAAIELRHATRHVPFEVAIVLPMAVSWLIMMLGTLARLRALK